MSSVNVELQTNAKNCRVLNFGTKRSMVLISSKTVMINVKLFLLLMGKSVVIVFTNLSIK